jgi:hypothetical protein
VLFARLLAKWLNPATSFATAFDPVAGSKLSGFLRKKRGVMAGCPDNWIVHCGRLVCVELKTPVGRCSRAQREVREALLRARCEWWECRSANAAMWALTESGVKFRELERSDGTVERWQQPELEEWEVPRQSPRERRPRHPALLARDREVQRRRRERLPALKAAAGKAQGRQATRHDAPWPLPKGCERASASPLRCSGPFPRHLPWM